MNRGTELFSCWGNVSQCSDLGWENAHLPEHPTEKQRNYGPCKRRGTENWLKCQAQKLMFGDTQSLRPFTSGQYRDQYYLMSSLVDGKNPLLTSLQVLQSWEEWLIDQIVVIPSRPTLTCWRNELKGTSWTSTKGDEKFCTCGGTSTCWISTR